MDFSSNYGSFSGTYALTQVTLIDASGHFNYEDFTVSSANFPSVKINFNDAPTSSAQTISTNEDEVKAGKLAGADIDGNTLTFIKVANPSHGTVTVNASTGAYTYTPVANYNGSDSFTFKVNDGTADSATATVNITVGAVNDAPLATAASASTNEDIATTGTLAGTDVDGNTLTFTKVANPSHGTVTVNASTGAYIYTPVANYNGSDSFTFKVNDGTVDSAIATVNITVSAVNDAPLATAASAFTNEDIATTGTLAGTDLDGNPLTYAKASDPTHGNVVINATTGAYVYVPAANYFGSDSFTYIVNDGTVNSETATVSVTVHPVNDLPAGDIPPSSLIIDINSGFSLNLINPTTLANGKTYYFWDVNGDGLAGGSGDKDLITHQNLDALFNAGSNTIDTQPDGIQVGVDDQRTIVKNNFTIALPSLSELSDFYTEILPKPPVGWAPSVHTYWSSTLSVGQFNSNLPGGAHWYCFLNDQTDQLGNVYLHAFSSGDNGNCYVALQVIDTQLHPQPEVSITGVPAQYQTLVATNNITDADGIATSGAQSIHYQWSADGVNIVGATGDTFSITQDEVGKTINVTATYTDLLGTVEAVYSNSTPAVLNVNDAPVALGTSVSTNEDTPTSGTLSGTDMDGNTLTFAKLEGPSHGTVSINVTTGSYTYTPSANFFGTDSFTFKVNDGAVDSATATVNITVAAINDVPSAVSESLSTVEDTALTGKLAGSDIEGNSLSFVNVAGPSHGTVSLNATTGAYSYSPNSNYNGSDSFTFKVNDGSLDSALATVNITIDAVNDAPVGIVLINGNAIEGQTLTATNTITDVDGIPTSGAGSVHYQWMADGANIAGATNNTLTLKASLASKVISVRATYTDQEGSAEVVTSASTNAVVGIFTGAVIDGYVSGSTVFADIDGDLQLDWTDKNSNGKFDEGEGEAWAISDALGGYTFNTSANLTGVNIVSKGGVDITTQADVGLMLAPTGVGYITPISTVFAYADKATPGGGAALLSALGLSASDLAYDPVAQLQNQGTTAGANAAIVLKAGASLLTMVNAASALAVELGNGAVDATQAAKGVFSQIASMGAGVSNLLSSDATASQAALKSVLTASLSSSGINTSNLSGLIDASANSISAVTTSIQKLDATAIAEGDQVGLARLGQETLSARLSQVAAAVESGGSNAAIALSNLSATYSSSNITQLSLNAERELSPVSGIVYSWKSHMLLSGVNVQLTPQSDGVSHLYELRNVHLTASGDVTAEVWANLGSTAVQSLQFDLGIDGGATGTFTADTATLGGFLTTSGNTAGHVSLGAITTGAGLSGSVRLGTLSLDEPVGTTLSSVNFVKGEAGASKLAAYGVKVGALLDTTDANGAYGYEGLDAGLYALDLSMTSVSSDADAITAADALAALKIAVGRNPNGDGSMAISPYQFIAADVTGDSLVTAADALAILKMAVGRTGALPREWLFVREDEDFWNEATKTFTTNNDAVVWDNKPYDVSSPAALTQNFVAVLKGDVNGNWAAPAGSEKLADSYFTDLVARNPNSMQLSQWGIAPLAV